jgi:hypothetical protein
LSVLEASAEAGFALQRRIIAITGLHPGYPWFAVGQPGDVLVARAGDGNFA